MFGGFNPSIGGLLGRNGYIDYDPNLTVDVSLATDGLRELGTVIHEIGLTNTLFDSFSKRPRNLIYQLSYCWNIHVCGYPSFFWIDQIKNLLYTDLASHG